MTARRGAVSAGDAEAAGRSVSQRLLDEPHVVAAERVALYAALGGELPLRALFDALADRCRLSFPRCAPDRRLEFREVARWEDLLPGRYGVLEPSAEAPAMSPSETDVVLVPGLAFDRAGHRLGRGQGWYDRTFAPGAPRAPWLVGIGYDFQLVASVPHAARDRRLDAVCSDAALHIVTGGTR